MTRTAWPLFPTPISPKARAKPELSCTPGREASWRATPYVLRSAQRVRETRYIILWAAVTNFSRIFTIFTKFSRIYMFAQSKFTKIHKIFTPAPIKIYITFLSHCNLCELL